MILLSAENFTPLENFDGFDLSPKSLSVAKFSALKVHHAKLEEEKCVTQFNLIHKKCLPFSRGSLKSCTFGTSRAPKIFVKIIMDILIENI